MVFYAVMNISQLKDSETDILREKVKKHFIKSDTLKRKESVAAKALLCFLLKKHYKLFDFTVDCDKNGKPFITDSEIFFNLSHSGSYVLCAVGNEKIGCDIQEIKKCNLKVAQRFFTESECICLEKSENKALDFTSLWSLKESVLKFSGEGIVGGLDRYDFSEYYNKGSFTYEGLCFDRFEFENFVASICSEKGCISQLNADIEDIMNFDF